MRIRRQFSPISISDFMVRNMVEDKLASKHLCGRGCRYSDGKKQPRSLSPCRKPLSISLSLRLWVISMRASQPPEERVILKKHLVISLKLLLVALLSVFMVSCASMRKRTRKRAVGVAKTAVKTSVKATASGAKATAAAIVRPGKGKKKDGDKKIRSK